eukprot:Platyproteum_vivax@DN6950_c0_g1_i1.p1
MSTQEDFLTASCSWLQKHIQQATDTNSRFHSAALPSVLFSLTKLEAPAWQGADMAQAYLQYMATRKHEMDSYEVIHVTSLFWALCRNVEKWKGLQADNSVLENNVVELIDSLNSQVLEKFVVTKKNFNKVAATDLGCLLYALAVVGEWVKDQQRNDIDEIIVRLSQSMADITEIWTSHDQVMFFYMLRKVDVSHPNMPFFRQQLADSLQSKQSNELGRSSLHAYPFKDLTLLLWSMESEEHDDEALTTVIQMVLQDMRQRIHLATTSEARKQLSTLSLCTLLSSAAKLNRLEKADLELIGCLMWDYPDDFSTNFVSYDE